MGMNSINITENIPFTMEEPYNEFMNYTNLFESLLLQIETLNMMGWKNKKNNHSWLSKKK